VSGNSREEWHSYTEDTLLGPVLRFPVYEYDITYGMTRVKGRCPKPMPITLRIEHQIIMGKDVHENFLKVVGIDGGLMITLCREKIK
jgi:hypothetical protein